MRSCDRGVQMGAVLEHQRDILALPSRVGAKDVRIADHAIELALSDRRSTESVRYLARNCRRDACRILRRREKTHPPTPVSTIDEVLKGSEPSPSEALIATELRTAIDTIA